MKKYIVGIKVRDRFVKLEKVKNRKVRENVSC